jgi:hypothetical protein
MSSKASCAAPQEQFRVVNRAGFHPYGMPTPRHQNLPRVYLAGKIAKNDWRGRLTGDVKTSMEDEALDGSLVLRVKTPAHHHFFDWTGPFAVACDHGCAHGPSTHGAGISVCATFGETTKRERRDLVHSLNRQRIERSTGLFAYIDETDCFGTLAEIGHAHGKGIPVGICYGPRITVHGRDALWFAEHYASWVYDAMPLEDAFEDFYWQLGNLEAHRHRRGSSVPSIVRSSEA